MSWRIVSVSSMSKLDYKLEYLVVRNREGTTRIHLSEVSILILESTAISLTAYLLRELDRRKIAVIFCDEARMPYGMLSSLYGSHDTSLRYRKQTEWTKEAQDTVWAAIVRQKIIGQISVLPPEREDAKQLLESYLPQILPGDTTNREGHAAKVYFNALFGKEFSRSSDCAVNAALNFGYSILLSATAREITACGYCTQLGIFHNNRFNRLNLASDLMEPFRPFIDARMRGLSPDRFEREEKREIIAILNQQLFVSGKEQYFLNALRIYVRSVLDALDAGEAGEILFPAYDAV